MAERKTAGKKIGYARVSSSGQSLDLQVEKLIEAGVNKDDIFMEKQSGAKSDRPELKNALRCLREGDKLVVYKIDRLARSIFDLQKIAKDLTEKGIGLVFIKEQIDFSTPSGKLMFNMLGSIAEFERDLINARTAEGRERAKKQGKHMGRPGQDEKAVKKAVTLYRERDTNGMSVNDIVKLTGVPRSTIYAKVKEETKSRKRNRSQANVYSTGGYVRMRIEQGDGEKEIYVPLDELRKRVRKKQRIATNSNLKKPDRT